jgi:uncharacterized membrane protein
MSEPWRPSRISSAAASPERVFALCAGIAGMLLVLLSPPFRWGDENVHFLNALRLSEGRLLRDASPRRGASSAPRGARALILYFSMKQLRSPDRTVSLRDTLAARAITLRPDERAPARTPRSPYAPIAYLPQAIGILLARLATDSVLLLVLAARVANFAAWAVLTWLAIRTAPGLRWTLCIVALAPMSLFLATSCNVDALTNGLAFLWTACVLKAAVEDRELGRRDLAQLAVLAALLSITKFVYVCLILLLFLVPARRFGGAWRRFGAGTALVAIGVGAVATWLLVSDPQSSFNAGPQSRRAQGVHLRAVVQDPVWGVRVVVNTVTRSARRWAHQLADTHWDKKAEDTRLLLLWSAALVLALVCDPPFASGPTAAQRLVALAAATTTMAALVLVAYLLWTSLFASMAKGVQGRYVIPLLPALAIAVAPPLWIRDPRLRGVGCATALVLASIPIVATLLEGWDLSTR